MWIIGSHSRQAAAVPWLEKPTLESWGLKVYAINREYSTKNDPLHSNANGLHHQCCIVHAFSFLFHLAWSTPASKSAYTAVYIASHLPTCFFRLDLFPIFDQTSSLDREPVSSPRAIPFRLIDHVHRRPSPLIHSMKRLPPIIYKPT